MKSKTLLVALGGAVAVLFLLKAIQDRIPYDPQKPDGWRQLWPFWINSL